ncbi:response regulator transcription factor [Actinomadura physcomitrii]|uniref:response regulator transcription factor n=1 Tax=Actinomadura physcomitrii TaxID=2650748 RepID=UPI002E269D49
MSAAGGAGLRVLILTTYDLDHYVYAALTAGASGFLLKDVTPERLTASVRLVQAGDALLAPAITRRLIERFAPRDDGARWEARPAVHRDLSQLTPRELEVLGLLATGLSNAELAERLTLSAATVKTHVARILAKLDLRDRGQAVVSPTRRDWCPQVAARREADRREVRRREAAIRGAERRVPQSVFPVR